MVLIRPGYCCKELALSFSWRSSNEISNNKITLPAGRHTFIYENGICIAHVVCGKGSVLFEDLQAEPPYYGVSLTDHLMLLSRGG
jgi:hypothetical protein